LVRIVLGVADEVGMKLAHVLDQVVPAKREQCRMKEKMLCRE
jgi:hypothetical protein